MRLVRLLTGSVAAKVLALVAFGIILQIVVSLIYSHYSARQLADEFATEQTKNLTDNYFDSLNKLMLTGGMDHRDELRKSILSQKNIIDARVIRGESVKAQYVEGPPEERPQDALDQQALQGNEVVVIQEVDGKRHLTVVRPFRATENTRGVNCMQCHPVETGTVLGAARITYDLAPVDGAIGRADLVNAGINLALFAIGFSIVIWLMRRIVAQPINRLTATMAQVERESNLTLRIPVSSHDEIGHAAQAFNAMLGRFASIVEQVRGATGRLSELSGHLPTTTTQSQDGVAKQLADTEHLEVVLQQLASTVQHVAQSIQEAAAAAQSADGQARDGALVATEAMGAIEAMAERLKSSVAVIQRLDEDSRGIGRVLGLIREIAEQTNLLALNAAIEAARAGEQGRGFAVVADEVRTLAQRTQSATGEIEGIILNVQQGAQQAVDAIRDAEARTHESVEHVENTAVALAEIAGSVGQITGMTQEVASSAQEQSNAAEGISRKVGDISEVARESATRATDVHSTCEQLARLSGELRQAVDQFKV